MKGRLGAVLTTGLAAVALALALLQAAVLAHSAPRHRAVSAVRAGPTNRYSVPGGRSGIPWLPFGAQKTLPEDSKSREGRSPVTKPPEEHRTPAPSRQQRMFPPNNGPHPVRRAAA
jgi:hypothetical protein